MGKCLSCQKEAPGRTQYHPACLKKLFGVGWVPQIPFGIKDMPAEVSKSNAKMSISGVQIKASVKLDREKQEIVMVQSEATHVLKAEPNEYPELPQNENCCMNMARELGMNVPSHGLLTMADGKFCYLIKRFDRLENGEKIHKESMAQILSVSTEDKYQGSLENIGKVIQRHSKNVGLDLVHFFERALFSFLIGNGDMHLKNWAVLTLSNGEIHLAPCYDFVCSKMYLPQEEDFALSINGRKNGLKKQDFIALGKSISIETKVIESTFELFRNAKEKILEIASHSELSPSRQEKFKEIILERVDRFYGNLRRRGLREV
ncbi:MAG: HipA domain-containing protein [Elusimicrobia bacterium]|nr:HipA domain-containing protein [Elusimicrobiota bacterium]MBI3013212.1 HipA domain-containing protein [Elusimicrobiota bacterium]MBI4217668.1 HipA domain-containing protein [Elusimicrobiota bacterium]